MAEIPVPRRVRGPDDVPPVLDAQPEALIEELQAAYEKLRVAEEEIQVQRGEIEQFVASRDEAVRQHQRNIQLAPSPIFITDRRGTIKDANAAATAFLRTRVDDLRGTAVFTLVTPESRHGLHRLFEHHDPASGPCICHLDLLPDRAEDRTARHAEPLRVRATLLPAPHVPDEITWVLLPSGDADRAAGDADRAAKDGDLAEALTELAALPPVTGDVRGYVQAAAAIVAGHAGDAAGASIVLGAVQAPYVLGASNANAQRLDGAQMAAYEGPTLTAYDSAAVVESRALATDERWPGLARRVGPADGGVVAAPLTDTSGPVGVVTVYLPARSWDEGLAQRLPLLAAAIEAGVQELGAKAEVADLVTNLRIALDSRATIEQAKGILMATKGCDADAAFAELVERSSLQHRKLRDVARDIVDGVAQPSPRRG